MLIHSGVPFRTRLSLLATAVRRRLRPADAYYLRLGKARVPLSHADYGVDWETMRTIVVDQAYETDYDRAVVVDVGAHKGCFGAFALERGAREVVSYEPEEVNFGYLSACAASCGDPTKQWRVRRAAVGGTAGTANLHVMGASWGHALAPSVAAGDDEVGLQHVPVVSMKDVLAEASAAAGPDPLLVKVNAEGAECSIVLETPLAAWERVTELLVEVHSWAPCTAEDIAAYVSRAGLESVVGGNVHWVHRLSRRG